VLIVHVQTSRARSSSKVISLRDVEFIELTGFANVLIVHVST
jgi:hypothetical protein